MLIGIVGNIGTGKTTVANYLVTKRGFTEITFSTPLKQIAEIFGFEKSQLYGTQEEKLEINKLWGISGREFMQKFGTEICREQFPRILNIEKVWIKLFEKAYEESKSNNIVVSDVRFEDEADSIKRKGGILVRINRKTKHNINHKSELQNFKIDFVIENNTTIINLYRKINSIINV